MNLEEREKVLNKIFLVEKTISVGDNVYKIKLPTIEIRYKANLLYNQTIDDCKYNDWMTDGYILELLIRNGLWTKDSDKNLEQIEKRLDEKKVGLFKDFFVSSRANAHRKEIGMIRKKISEMKNIRRGYDYITPEGYANIVKTQYLISQCIYSDNKLVDVSFPVLNSIINAISYEAISVDDLREIARTDPWRSYYSIDKANLFGVPPIAMTEEQRTLLAFSRMYDNVYEHPECPDDDIIEDDDAFDGWIIFQKEKIKEEKSKNKIDNVLTEKQKGAGEVYIMAKSQDEANEIYSANSIEAKQKLKQRAGVIKSKEEVREGELPDKRLEKAMQANQQFIDKHRR